MVSLKSGTKKAILVLLLGLPLLECFAAGTGPEQYNPTVVDISRLPITRVSANSVNGGTLSNNYYGVLNLFDDGSNVINNINYTCWLSAPNEMRHWIKLSFLKPVAIHSVFVETSNRYKPTEYGLELYQVSAGLRRVVRDFDSIPVKGFRTTYKLPEPVRDVNELMIIFPGPGMLELCEVKVMGQVPVGTDLTPQRPLIAESKYEEQGPHIIEVERTLRGENDERMIGIAESTYPPREDVVKAIAAAHFKLDEVPEEEKLWWYSEFDNVRIPYAITGDAVCYYVKLVEGFREKNWKSDIEPSSQFTYSAGVEFKRDYEKDGKRFRNVYVVEMKLSMRAQFALEAGVGFSKERTVVLDRNGWVLAVFGDGTTPTLVS